MPAGLQHTVTSFAVLLVVFLPLERLFSARKQGVLRLGFWADLCYFFGQYLLWNAPVVAAILWAYSQFNLTAMAPMRAEFASWSWGLQFAVAMLISDCAIYWAHRWQHNNAFLWRFHRVHHTAERMDWLAAHREHPLDNIYTRTVENVPLLLLGFPMVTIAGFAVFRGMWAIFIHSNTTLSPGPLRYLLGAPRLHHWHHAIETKGQVNFANLSPLMDLMFGTYYDPRRMPERVGIEEPFPRNYVAALIEPMVPKRWQFWRS
ncbi:MAG: sterol desaturase/sphingolipid hydroxylase (fatty acid hydroxylase superfamily) [Planctomycetota bacterium]|jgi:sterol desaturase/sphingolipid hydroxylase (fatty acid hydroxylase superfamily)